jgi:threonylcarbamoyladenosine tRNA methylthiotransferase MtaB
MGARPLAAVLTLGCKLNLADSEAIARGLRGAGFDVVDRLCDADAFVVNTCSVTHVADQKSRRLIRSVRRMAPGAAVAVTGCFPQSAGDGVATALGADIVVGTRADDHARLTAFLADRAAAGGHASPAPGARNGLHTRAFIKAQEGCNDVCAFCIVPRTRGREASRPAAEVAADVRRAAEDGAREMVITGTQLGAWGRDLEQPSRPADLIAAVLEQTEVARVRFSSLQPQDITPELLALWGDPRLMPHFHLALQSGSESVLRSMRRRYTATGYMDAVARIRAAVPGVAITTDVIAGFPGEDDEDFEATLALCREAGFARLHCFPYSQRSHTAAARMRDQVTPGVRQERMQRLLALGKELSLRFRRGSEGEVRPVLWEGIRELGGERAWHGHSDNYVAVYGFGYGAGVELRNRLTPVAIGPVYHDGVRGTPAGGAA